MGRGNAREAARRGHAPGVGGLLRAVPPGAVLLPGAARRQAQDPGGHPSGPGEPPGAKGENEPEQQAQVLGREAMLNVAKCVPKQ
jgi:hypothetical protein